MALVLFLWGHATWGHNFVPLYPDPLSRNQAITGILADDRQSGQETGLAEKPSGGGHTPGLTLKVMLMPMTANSATRKRSTKGRVMGPTLSVPPHVRHRHCRLASDVTAAMLGAGLSRTGDTKLSHSLHTIACKEVGERKGRKQRWKDLKSSACVFSQESKNHNNSLIIVYRPFWRRRKINREAVLFISAKAKVFGPNQKRRRQ